MRFPQESLLLGSAKPYTQNGLEFYQRCERIAGMVRTRFVWKRAYIITEPSAIAEVLITQANSFTKPYVLRRLKVLFGDGLLTADGEVWKLHRRVVQPAFTSERMSAFVELVGKNLEETISCWREGEVRDITEDLVELCLKNISQTMFGVYDDELGDIVRALATTCHELVNAVFDVIRPVPFRFTRRLRRQVAAQREALNRYLEGLIDQRSLEPPRNDFLGLLLSGDGHHRPLTRKAILDESVTMLLAGHETSTAALVWALYLLAQHPREADALAKELAGRLGGRAPSYEQLADLESLRATLDETLRLYPSTHRIARTVDRPVTVGGHLLPAGADVVLPQWAVHRSTRWYHEPEEFRPARWTAEFRKSLPRFAYFPFSGGARTCIGAQLAWTEGAAMLALLTQRFRFSLCDSEPLKPVEGLTLLAGSGGVRMRVESRRYRQIFPRPKAATNFNGWTKPASVEIW